MKKIGFFLMGVALLLLLASSAQAVVLAEIPLYGGAATQIALPAIPFHFKAYYESEQFEDGFLFIFDELIYAPEEWGEKIIFTKTAGDFGFNDIVSFLTNGEEEKVGISWTLSGLAGGAREELESSFFEESPFRLNGIDLEGSYIQSIQFVIDRLGYETGWDELNERSWTEAAFATRLVINGPDTVVPEPATMVFLGLGALGFFARKKK